MFNFVTITNKPYWTEIKEGTTVGLADGILLADNKTVYEAKNLKVGLFKS